MNPEAKRFKRDVSTSKEDQKKTLLMSGKLFVVAFQKLLQKMGADATDMYYYMQKVLHAIFFLGHINKPQVTPAEFFPNEVSEGLRKRFPKPFTEYATHLPSLTPYSILLEYITKALDSRERIMSELATINRDFRKTVANDFAFSASVIAYSHVCTANSPHLLKEAYGASISCKGLKQRTIMIAISTLYVWDKAVSYAVCSGNSGDGITFPPGVNCNAQKFHIDTLQYENVAPCVKCNKMFVVDYDPEHQINQKKEAWPYGNCAETESLSRLLHGNGDIRNSVYTTVRHKERVYWADIENTFKQEYEAKKLKEAEELLSARDFKVPPRDWQLFSPAA